MLNNRQLTFTLNAIDAGKRRKVESADKGMRQLGRMVGLLGWDAKRFLDNLEGSTGGTDEDFVVGVETAMAYERDALDVARIEEAEAAHFAKRAADRAAALAADAAYEATKAEIAADEAALACDAEAEAADKARADAAYHASVGRILAADAEVQPTPPDCTDEFLDEDTMAAMELADQIEAIEAEQQASTEAQPVANEKPVPTEPKPGTKTRIVYDMMRRPGGATSTEILAATAWACSYAHNGRDFCAAYGLGLVQTREGRTVRFELVSKEEAAERNAQAAQEAATAPAARKARKAPAAGAKAPGGALGGATERMAAVMRRPEGATVTEILAAAGWKAINMPLFIAKHPSLDIRTDKQAKPRRYFASGV